MLDFNFGNTQTFHVFQWIMHSGKVDRKDLIAKAYDRVETKDNLLYDVDGDITMAVATELAQVTYEFLEDFWGTWAENHGIEVWELEGEGTNEYTEPASYERDHALFVPLLVDSLDGLNWRSLTEAILRSEGKWSPSRERPKAI